MPKTMKTDKQITISPQFSFAGYSIKEWLKGTLETFKGLTSAAIGVAVYFIEAAPEPYNVILAPVAIAFSKWLMDAIHFWAGVKE